MSDTAGHLHDIVHVNKKGDVGIPGYVSSCFSIKFKIMAKYLFSLRKARIRQSQHEAKELLRDEKRVKTCCSFPLLSK